MLAPSVVPIALRAAILALVLPFVFCPMLHPEQAIAFWVLANKRLVIRALAAAKAMACQYPAGGGFKSLAA